MIWQSTSPQSGIVNWRYFCFGQISWEPCKFWSHKTGRLGLQQCSKFNLKTEQKEGDLSNQPWQTQIYPCCAGRYFVCLFSCIMGSRVPSRYFWHRDMAFEDQMSGQLNNWVQITQLISKQKRSLMGPLCNLIYPSCVNLKQKLEMEATRVIYSFICHKYTGTRRCCHCFIRYV